MLEIGTHSTLRGPISDVLSNLGISPIITYFTILNRFDKAQRSALDLFGRLWASGYSVNIQKLNGLGEETMAVRTDLPTYPFNHAHQYWFEDRASESFRLRSHRPHELLGSWVPTSSTLEARWRNFLRSDKPQWTQDHQVSHRHVQAAETNDS